MWAELIRMPEPCLDPPEPEPSGKKCNYCGEDICVGDKYYTLDGMYYHEECLDENAGWILREFHDADYDEAEKEDDEW